MKLLIIIFMFVVSGCTDATEDKKSTAKSETCEISFKNIGPCVYGDIKVNLGFKKVATDEKIMQRLDVEKHGKKFSMNISKDTSILDGDKGYISFADINFDSIPDISITTSFGLANLYMDYWVYNSVNKSYLYIGNFSSFKINNKSKTLSNVVKSSAAEYTNTTYIWDGLKLIKK